MDIYDPGQRNLTLAVPKVRSLSGEFTNVMPTAKPDRIENVSSEDNTVRSATNHIVYSATPTDVTVPGNDAFERPGSNARLTTAVIAATAIG